MANDQKLDWIYKGANSLVDREDYLLGRKVDKTLEQLNEEEKEKKFVLPTPKNHVEHECIPPSIRDFNKIVLSEQVDLSAKLQEDPLVAIKKREEEARRQFLQNPIQLKKLQEALQKQQAKKNKKSKKKDLDKELDKKIKEKLKLFKNKGSYQVPNKDKKKSNGDALDTILMHKFNALKDKLSESDLNDILQGKVSDTSEEDEPRKKNKEDRKKDDSDSSESSDDYKHKSRRNEKGNEKRKMKNRKSFNKNDTNSSSEEESRRKDSSSKKVKRNTEDSSSDEGNSRRGNYRVKRRSRSRDRVHSRDHELRRERNKLPEGNKSRSRDKYKSRYVREDDRERNSPRRRNEVKRKDNSSESESSQRRSKKEIKKEKREENPTNDNLDQKIMEKLRLLRGEAEGSTRKTLLPEKPLHLRGNSETSDSSSSDSEVPKTKYYSDEEQPKPKSFGLVTSEGKKVALGENDLSKKPVATSSKKEAETVKPERKQVKKLTEEEKQQLRRQMMQNAVERDHERERNVKKYKEEDQKEEKQTQKRFDVNVVHNKLVRAAEHSSVEQRIKSNLGNIQRSSRHMESNFSRR